MFPILIDLGSWNLPFLGETPIFLPTYGALFAGSVVLGWWWFGRRTRGLDIDADTLFNLTFYTLLAGLLGAKALLILIDWRFYLEHPKLILATIRSAGVLLGGVIAGAATFVLYCRKKGLPTWRLADAIAAPLALGQGIGRLGCWSAGCCWGRGTHADHPLATVFTNPRAGSQTGVPLDTPLIAVQPIQMVADLLLAGFLTWLWRRKPEPAGTVFWSYVLIYSLTRGTIEFWRGDANRGLWLDGAVSTSQLISLAGIVVAAVVLLAGRRRSAPAPARQ